jgi:hypothetical protein
MDLGIFDRLKGLTMYFLNSTGKLPAVYLVIIPGIKWFQEVLKSDVLLVGRGHRLRNCAAWSTKWNGNNTSIILPSITSLWFLVIRKEYLDKKFWGHIQQLEQSKKTDILLQYGFNVDDQSQGKYWQFNVP